MSGELKASELIPCIFFMYVKRLELKKKQDREEEEDRTTTLKMMSKLLYCQEKSFTVQILNLYIQTRVSDCALYAMTVATSMASNADPASVIFDQVDLRSHFRQCMETGKVARFPVTKKRRPVSCILATKECFVYCYCRMSDSGELMICCNQCSDWFHQVCITNPIPSDIEQWKYICNICQQKCLSPSETI